MSLRLWPASSLSFESDPEESSLGILEVGESAEAGAILTNKSDGDAYEAGCQVYGSSSQGAPIVSFIDSTESLYRSDVGESFLTWEAPDAEGAGEAEDTGDTGGG